jgi:AAA domain
MSTIHLPNTPIPQLADIDTLRACARPDPGWLWHGYLAPGNATLLTSQWKAGKTTLVSVLLSKMKSGGTLAGLAVRPGRAIVVSEESIEHWLTRHDRLHFGPNIQFICRPFRGRPTTFEWMGLIDRILARHNAAGLDLVVIDPLAAFLPGRTENDAGTMLDVLLPLQRLTGAGIAVLINHHPKKGEPPPGHAARGSGALSGYVDVIIEMTWYGRATDDERRRKLAAFSRLPETTRRLVIGLTDDGNDYVSHGDFAIDDFDEGWQVVSGVLEDADGKQTRREILDHWPQDFPKPAATTLWRWLDRALASGWVLKEGTGRNKSPFRYWLDGMEEVWRSSPFYLEPLPPLDEVLGVAPRLTRAEALAERSPRGEPAA